MTTVDIRPPYLILVGDEQDDSYAKTAFGIVQWRPELVAGQLRFDGCGVDLGVPDLSISEAAANGVRSLIVGVAPIGGFVPDSWWLAIEEAARAGIDVVGGLHTKLSENDRAVAAAASSGARLVDVRVPPRGIPVGTGIKRAGRRLLTVGTDCAIGKKYSALALERAMRDAGFNTTFRATGQTGIMIAGSGMPLDAVIADFVAGAAEQLSPENADDHWDIIEGQGALLHPAYAGVSLGLLHGSQPDAIVVCHEADRQEIEGWPGYPVPSVIECMHRNLLEGKLTNAAIQCVGICVNTSKMADAAKREYLDALAAETKLPCVDPIADGCDAIVETIREQFAAPY